MAKTKIDSEFRGYRARFKGDILKETLSEHACGTCGARTMYLRQWRAGDRPGVAMFHIEGTCENGHEVDRYGYGEVPA